ncbi:MAG: monovalent cation/H+ antiporter subunit D [Steroidobacteraceae bacterium]
MSAWLQHLPVLPIVVPLLTGALLLLFAETRRLPRLLITLAATLTQLAAAVTMVWLTTDSVPEIWPRGIGVYAIGGWDAPFGIVLVVDRLSALMIAVNITLALAVIVYSIGRWDRMGVHYHSLLQLLLMGLNGAFLTGDLFNLFVFFEILLAASYALLLHGGGPQRTKMSLHFIAVNLTASFAFLIGIAMIYGVAGTLNMAEIAWKWRLMPSDERSIAQVGASILGIAFLVKAAAWPLDFWLPGAYHAAGAPVAAIFTIATKVGVYAVLRAGSLLEDPSAPFGGVWLFYVAIATMLFGIVGMLASRQLPRLVAFVVIISSGTILAAVGSGEPSMIAPALYYMLGSVFATAAFFLLTGMAERMRTALPDLSDRAATPPPTYTAFAVGEPPDPYAPDDEVGVALPAAMAFLGLAFVSCTLLVTGMPPLAGFIAKFSLAAAAIDAISRGSAVGREGLFVIVLLASGFAGLAALLRVGMRLFWSVAGRQTPRLSITEAGPVAFLILVCMGITIAAGQTMTYLDSAAAGLADPQLYIQSVLQRSRETAP